MDVTRFAAAWLYEPDALQLPVAIAVLVTSLCVACAPEIEGDGAVPASCNAIGALCQLPDGPLGVCEQIPCAAGDTPPCFVCTPQH